MDSFLLEVCCYTLDEVQAAADAGADRIELCADREGGGTTPSLGIMEAARGIFSGGLMVMIRPRAGFFIYSLTELRAMLRDVELAREAGADGIVSGILNEHSEIDLRAMSLLRDTAKDLDFTFHRAIDSTPDYGTAFAQLHNLGIHRVLSSGMKTNVNEGRETLSHMSAWNSGSMEVLAGGGLNADNCAALYEAGIREFHFTAYQRQSDSRSFRDNFIPHPEKIHEIRAALRQAQRMN